MSILTYHQLVKACDQGIIAGVHHAQINSASVDITLGDSIWIETAPANPDVLLAGKEVPCMREYNMAAQGPFHFKPGGFCLAATREIFNLPADDPEFGAIVGEYKLKSSLARAGLGALLAMHCDPGWNGSVLTLELVNHLRYHTLVLSPGMRIGQIILHSGAPVPEHASYAVRGQYCGDLSATPSKGVR